MDYKNMKKEEMLQKLEEQRHLAEAIDAKDAEIAKISKEKDVEVEKISKQKDAEIAKIHREKDAEIVRISKEFESFKEAAAREKNAVILKSTELEKIVRTLPTSSQVEEATKKLEEENKKLINHLGLYVEAFRNLLKANQGVLDNAIQMEAFISESLRRK
jgi:exopolysaccharide biosynthesis protein